MFDAYFNRIPIEEEEKEGEGGGGEEEEEEEKDIGLVSRGLAPRRE